MGLAELVRLNGLLVGLKLHEFREFTDRIVSSTDEIQVITEGHDSVQQGIIELIDNLTEYNQGLNKTQASIDKLIELTQNDIDAITKDWKYRSYYINDMLAVNVVDPDTDRNMRKLLIDKKTEESVRSKIETYCSWKHASLEIGPGDGYWTNSLVAGDPLYLVDIHEEFLNSTISKFTQQYQRRLRKYIVSPHADSFTLSTLPQGQFGFIFAWNVFDYFPYENIRVYLQQCFDLLKPGGVMMFSYNNCEVPACASLAEVGFKSWMPKWLLLEAINLYHYEVISFSASEKTTSDKMSYWVEIKKPGELKSVRTSQSLAAILPRPGFNKSVDYSTEKVYNEQQIRRIRQIAIEMNLANPEDIMRNKISPHKLHEMIDKARNQK